MDSLQETGAWYELHPVGLVMLREPSFEEWAALVNELRDLAKAIPWIIGDLLAQGETRYGETYAQAMDASGYSLQTLMNYTSVCRRVPLEIRHEELSFKHHQLVSALEESEQGFWLGRASMEHWTTTEFQDELRGRNLIGQKPQLKVSQGEATVQEEIEGVYVTAPMPIEDTLVAVSFTEQELHALVEYLQNGVVLVGFDSAVQQLENAYLAR